MSRADLMVLWVCGMAFALMVLGVCTFVFAHSR